MDIVMMAMFFIALLLLAGFILRVIEGLERENRMAEAELRSSLLYRASLDDRVKEVRRYRHDADGLLRAIEFATGERSGPGGATGEAGLPGTGQAQSMGFGTGYCQLPLAEAAIQSKRHLCANAGVPFVYDADPAFARKAADRGLEEADLCILLQNLLDNAYEACARVAAAGMEPSMELQMEVLPDGRLRIATGNKVVSSAPPTFRTQKEHPELHGVGMEVIRDIAKAHGGAVRVDFDAATKMLYVAVTV